MLGKLAWLFSLSSHDHLGRPGCPRQVVFFLYSRGYSGLSNIRLFPPRSWFRNTQINPSSLHSHPTRTRNKRGVKAKNPRLVPSPSEHGRNPSRRECPGYLSLNRRSLHHINLLNYRQCNSSLNSRHTMLRLMDLYL